MPNIPIYLLLKEVLKNNFDDNSNINQLNTGYPLLDQIVNSMLTYNPNERISLPEILKLTKQLD